MLAAIHQPQYLPWLGYFEKMARADVFILLDNVQFKKNEWQNRNRIRTSQGWQWVTVPVCHNFGQKIHDVKLNEDVDWGSDHARAIELNYARAPFFAQYWQRLRPYYHRSYEDLSSVNTVFIEVIRELLGIKTKLVMASSLAVNTDKTQRLIDLCRAVGCDRYLAGAGCADYMDEGLLASSGIDLEIQYYQHPTYPQLWPESGGFIAHMSVLDLLFNCGPSSLSVLKG